MKSLNRKTSYRQRMNRVSRYSLKKLSVGLVSVVVGTGLLCLSSVEVRAEEEQTSPVIQPAQANTETEVVTTEVSELTMNSSDSIPVLHTEEHNGIEEVREAAATTGELDPSTLGAEEVMNETPQPIAFAAAPTAEQVTLKLSDYQVDATGYKDSGRGIYAALQAAKTLSEQGKHVTLEFEENASYTIQKEFAQVREVHTSNTSSVDFPQKSIGVLIEGIHNLTIDGNNASLVMEGDLMALGVFQSENVTIKNLSWDHRVPTTSELTVFDYDTAAGTVDYFIPNYFRYAIQGNSIQWQSEKDSSGQFYWTAMNDHQNYGISVKYPTEKMGRSYYSNQGPFQNVRQIEKLDNGLLRVTYNGSPRIAPVKGMNIQLVANAVRPTAGALVWESKDVTLENVQISYMHGFGFLVQMSENVTFDGIRMETDPQTGKHTSSYADGIHVSGAKGKIIVKNSFFNNTHDDPINIHGTFTRVEERLDNRTLKLKYIHHQQGGFPQFYKGDKVVFYSRDLLASRDNEHQYTVKSVQGPTQNNLKTMIVEFEEDIPDYVLERIGNEPKFVAENVTYTPEVEIRNNSFINVFTRHILVTSRKKVIIDGNTFEASTMPATFFSNDSDEWYESGPIRDLEITNNTFKIRSIGRTWWKYAPAIYFHPVTKGGGLPNSESPIHKNILIKGNTFYLESDGALRAESVENLQFINNKIYRLNPNIRLTLNASDLKVNETQMLRLTKEGNVVSGTTLPGGPERNSGSVANVLEFQASKNVQVSGNEYDDGLKRHVLVEAMNDSDYRIEDDLTVQTRRTQTQPSEPVGKVYYVSTRPDVVSIQADGQMTAHAAGTSEVYAYTIWNGTIIESNRQTVTVSLASVPEPLPLDTTVYALTDVAPTLTLQQQGTTLAAADTQFESLSPEVLTFAQGMPIVHRTGIAKVRVTHQGKVADIYVVANHTASQKQRADYLTVENENANIVVETDRIRIQRNSGEDLWQRDNNLNNLVHLSLEGLDLNHFAAAITLEGLPIRQQQSWDSSYFMLFKLKADGTLDRDNYISVGKRAHSDGFGTVKEQNQQGSETQTNRTEQNNVTSATFVIEKADNTVRLYAKEQEGYTLIHTYDNVGFLGNALALGVGGWGNTQANRTLTIADFKRVNGTKDDLVAATALPFKVQDTSNSELSDVQLIREEQSNRVRVQANNATRIHTIVVKDQDANVQEDTIRFNKVGDHVVYVVNESPTGKLSTPQRLVYTVIADQLTQTINGVELVGDMLLTIPEELTQLVYEVGGQREVIDIQNLESIERAGHTIQLKRVASNQAKVLKVETSLGNPVMTADNQFLYTEKSDTHVTLNITVSPATAQTRVVIPDHHTMFTVVAGEPLRVPIYNGVNSFEIQAIAADGRTIDTYRLHVLRNHAIRSGLRSVSVAGQAQNINQHEFVANSLSDLVVTPQAVNAKVSYSVLEETDDALRVLVKVQHEDKLSVEYHEYTLTKEKLADYSSVEKAMESIPTDLTAYTPESVQRVQEALANVIPDKKQSEQPQVDQYAKAIEEAVQALQLKPADYSQYDQVRATIPADLSLYTAESVARLEQAQQAVPLGKTILEQSAVDDAVAVLRQAIVGLMLRPQAEPEDNTPKQPETEAPQDPKRPEGETPDVPQQPDKPSPEMPKPSEPTEPEKPKQPEISIPEVPKKPELPVPGTSKQPEQQESRDSEGITLPSRPGESPRNTEKIHHQQEDGKRQVALPETGEESQYLIFGMAATSIIMSVGLLKNRRRNEEM